MKRIFGYLSILLFFVACSDASHKEANEKSQIVSDEIELIKHHDSLYYLTLTTDSTKDEWELPYPVYRFDQGDVDANGSVDFLVGVTKTTRFDSSYSKRLFIFKNYQGYVRPLWMGSRLAQPLEDFKFKMIDKEPRVLSIEKERSGLFLVAEYKWKRFGLAFDHYIRKEIELKIAYQILES